MVDARVLRAEKLNDHISFAVFGLPSDRKVHRLWLQVFSREVLNLWFELGDTFNRRSPEPDPKA